MMSNPFDYFEKIYCINLDSRTNRWQNVQKEFKKIDIHNRVERFSAIFDENGQKGCWLSHKSIIQKALSMNLKNVLIFEDDVKFLNINYAKLNNVIQLLDKHSWDLFYLGGRHRSQVKIVAPNLLQGTLRSTHAYAAHKNVFQTILGCYEKTSIDVWYSQNMRSLSIFPMVAVQSPNYSDVDKKFISWKEREFIFCQYYYRYCPKFMIKFTEKIFWKMISILRN